MQKNNAESAAQKSENQLSLLMKEQARVYAECGSRLKYADFREKELKQALDYSKKRIDELYAEKNSLNDELKEIRREYETLVAKVDSGHEDIVTGFHEGLSRGNELKLGSKEISKDYSVILEQLKNIREGFDVYFSRHRGFFEENNSARKFLRLSDFILYSESIAFSEFEIQNGIIRLAWQFEKTRMGDWSWPVVNLAVESKVAGNGKIVSLSFGKDDGVEARAVDSINVGFGLDVSDVVLNKFDGLVSTHDLTSTQYRVLEGLFESLVYSYRSGSMEFKSTILNSEIRNVGFCLNDILNSLHGERESFRYDRVHLKDTLSLEDYEQLWLKFENASWEDKFFSEFEFKIEAKGLKAEINGGSFANYLCISFRQIEDGGFPLEFWPPDSVDQYGAYMTYTFDIHKGRLMVTKGNEMVHGDARLLLSLIQKIPRILERLDEFEAKAERSREQWIFALNRLNAISSVLLKGLS